MKISWLILTYNRANSVAKAIPHCARNAGHKIHEIVWVDNGSSTEERADLIPTIVEASHILGAGLTQLKLPENLGVAKGYNRCMALAEGTHMVITGCDMMMPDNWLRDMVTVLGVAGCGISTIYAAPIATTPERIRGEAFTRALTVGYTEKHDLTQQFRLQEAMPIGRRLMSRELQREIGYFHEGFGLYGWDDVAWAGAAERVLKAKGLKSYCLTDRIAEHLGTEGNVGYDHKDEHAYWKWKQDQVNDPAKADLLRKLNREGHPRFSPF